MTNRSTQRPYSAGTVSKRPRLRRLEIQFDGPPPNTPEGGHGGGGGARSHNAPEGLNNGIRPHGGVRGMKQLPPGQFSHDKDADFANELDAGYQLLVNNENLERHGAPCWLTDVQREITHSGESPLFTNKLLATGKFEQLNGCVSFERALLRSKTKRLTSPRARHVNGVRQFYRPNSTHQYLSATDLRNMHENEENMIKFGRPTRTTLLRARQRSNSAPINAYDLRRESSKRIEEVKNNTIFCTSKEMYNLYATDGETMHSFLTGARYNRAHLLDSRGLTEFGVYMPRENPQDCFIAAGRRHKDAEEDLPSAPPDSPRSDVEDNALQTIVTRPMSGVVHYRPVTSSLTSAGRPPSSKSGTGNKATSSRPQSHSQGQITQFNYDRITSSKNPGSRPRSGKESIVSSVGHSTRSLPPKSADSSRRDQLPDEITMAMPDHINKTGRGGVYVTLKGQKMLETVESKLPRVTGVSLPKIRKSRDLMDEMAQVNQPPPTPIDASMADKVKQGVNNAEHKDSNVIEYNGDKGDAIVEQNENADQSEYANTQNKDEVTSTEREIIAMNISKLTVSRNDIIDKETIEIGPTKHVNFSEQEVTVIEEKPDKKTPTKDDEPKEDSKEVELKNQTLDQAGNNDAVKFFVTEDVDDSNETDHKQETVAVTAKSETTNKGVDNDERNDLEVKKVEHVIKVEISETEKSE